MTNNLAKTRGGSGLHRVIGIILAVSMVAAGALSADDAGKEKVSVAANPAMSDPREELMRLRNEGAARHESALFKKALESFQKALEMNPKSAIELYNVGVEQRKLNNAEEAKKQLNKAMVADAKMPQPYYVLGLIHKRAGETEAAIRMFKKARTLAPHDVSPIFQLSLLYRTGGNETAALQAIVDTLQIDPYHTGALYQLSQFNKTKGDTQAADVKFKEFARLKKIATASRRESNDEDSPLSRPIGSDDSAVANRGGTTPFKANFTRLTLDVDAPARSLTATTETANGKPGLIVATTSGQLARVEFASDGSSKVTQRWDTDAKSAADSVLAERFAVKEPMRMVTTSVKGVAISVPGAVSPASPWAALTSDKMTTLRAIDLDHDGDLDIVDRLFKHVFVNRGNAEFYADTTLMSEPAIRKVLDAAQDIVAGDFGDRGGVDLVAYTASGQRTFLQDAQGGQFVVRSAALPDIKGLTWMGKGDMDNDGLIDLVGIGANGLTIDFNRGRYQFDSKLVGVGSSPSDGKDKLTAAVADFDNDGLKDVLVLRAGSAPVLWHNDGQSKYSMLTLGAVSTSPAVAEPVVYDFDDDGAIDFVVLTEDGKLEFWRNQSTGLGKSMKIRLAGVRSPPSGQLAQVEVRKGSRYGKYESNGLPVHVGLGDSTYAEVLRLTWPNGFVENKLKVDQGRTWDFPESERISGSCPSVFAWAGDKFVFVTDAFISGPMGVPMGNGQRFPVDHNEYLMIESTQLKPVHNRYSIRLTEELREAVYLDQMRLYAVDHPADTDVYTNERLAPPPFPSFKLHETSQALPSTLVVDQNGKDVTDLVRRIDGRYPQTLQRLAYTGFTEPQGLVVTLPDDAATAPALRLFLTGWFYYFDSTSLTSASQRKDLAMLWPQVQEQRDGEWKTVAYTGIPPGKNKTIVVDLTGKLHPETKQIRLWSNIEIYWDRVLVDVTEPSSTPRYVMHEIPLQSAMLRFRGFSERQEAGAGRHPDIFDYQHVKYDALWNPLDGLYTRYGSVSALLTNVDSHMAVFGSGDEVALEFGPAQEAAIRPGWRRDFILYLDGFVKDGDRYTAHAGQVAPMPYAGMTAYPYADDRQSSAVFNDSHYQRYLREYQTRRPVRFTGPDLAARR